MKRWGLGIVVILFGSLFALLLANQKTNQITNANKQANNSTILTKKGLEKQGTSLVLRNSNKLAKLQEEKTPTAAISSTALSSPAKLASSVDDNSARITIAGVLSQKSGAALSDQVVYAKSSTEEIKLSTDGEGDFFVHLLSNQNYTLTTSNGMQLGSITTGATKSVVNDDGIIELGRTFKSESSSGYVQLNSNVIYFPESEVSSASSTSIIVNGIQNVYAGDIVLADESLNHLTAAAIEVTSVQYENNKTILNGTPLAMTSIFQEIHSGSYGSFGTVKVTPNTQVASRNNNDGNDNQNENSLVVNDGQGSTFNVEVGLTPSLKIDYSNTSGTKQIAASFKTTAKVQGSISAGRTNSQNYDIGTATITTDLPFLSVTVPLTLNESLQSVKEHSVNVTGEYTSSVNLQINGDKLTKTASHTVAVNLSGGTDSLSLSLGVTAAPSISMAGSELLNINACSGFSENVDAAANETQSSHYSDEIESPFLERSYSSADDVPIFKTADMQINTATADNVSDITLAPGEKKILYLPDYSSGNTDLTLNENGPITVTKLASGVYEVVANAAAVPETSANLAFLDASSNGHLVNSKGQLTVNIVNADKTSISGRILDASKQTGIQNAQITLVNEATGATYRTVSNASGEYVLELPSGNYQSTVTASGYQSANAVLGNIDTEGLKHDTELSLNVSNLHGVIKDSVTSAKIAGASLSFRAGADNTISEPVASSVTDENGEYHLSLPAGDYTVALMSNGFVTGYENITVGQNSEDTEVDGLLAKESTDFSR
ncbi:MAG: carboxypeptidase regulatory-like domain-containing protein [Liquorilactobacillus sp.]|uniref:carboxypeptidase regulatory-like domain-containing protein n=1 Tax=Liquorilactobacillus sp. TaxID=2767923 RepID=UPI0039E7B0C4